MELLEVVQLLAIGLLWVFALGGCWYMRRSFHKRRQAAELRAPLLPKYV